MWNNLCNRQDLLGAIFLLYFIPLMLTFGFITKIIPAHIVFPFAGFGLLITTLSSLIFFQLLLNFENSFESKEKDCQLSNKEELENAAQEALKRQQEAEQTQKELQDQIAYLTSQVETLQNQEANITEESKLKSHQLDKALTSIEDYQIQIEKLHQQQLKEKKDFEDFKQLSEKALEGEKQLSYSLQETISELRSTVEVKQTQIEKLETKIYDLTYEIKTLLQIADITQTTPTPEKETIGLSLNKSAEDYQVPISDVDKEHEEFFPTKIQNGEEAKKQLKRCVDIAQKITGSQYCTSGKSRFGELHLDNYTLNLRRLCDSLRSENSCTVFVYSPKDKKPIFINNQIKELLGWTPEKFVQDFENIVQDGIYEWKSSIGQLSSFNQSETRFLMKSKSGKDLLIHCQLGIIPTGAFRSNIIGILYPA